MRRFPSLLRALAIVVIVGFSTTASPVSAQKPLDILKRAAEDAKKKADEVKRKADSTKRASDSTKRAVADAKASAEGAKTAVEDAAKSITTTTPSGTASTAPPPAPTPSPRGTPASAQGRAPGGGAAAPAGIAASSAGPPQPSRSGVKVEEQTLITGEPGLQYQISPRGQHLAAVALRGSRMVMVFDGVDGPRFDEIMYAPGGGNGRVVFSEDGNRYAYVGRQGQDWVVMVDGKELIRGAPWTQAAGALAVTSLDFTPGDKHVYFTTFYAESQKQVGKLYIDGKPGPASEMPIRPLFSPDGEHHAYVIDERTQTGQKSQRLIIDGVPSPYPGGEPQFTSDGLHVFTKQPIPQASSTDIFADGKPFMRVTGAELHMAPTGSGVLGTVWLPIQNGRRTVFLTVGNRRVPNSDCAGSAGIDQVFFSPDAKHWAIRCQDATNAYWVMADGKKGQQYQSINSKVLFTADGRPVYSASMNSKNFLIVGEEELGPYQTIASEMVSTNPGAQEMRSAVVSGNRVGFVAIESGAAMRAMVVVVDGKPVQTENASHLAFSPEGSRYAFLSGLTQKQVIVEGLQSPPPLEGTPRVGIMPFVFSPDGKHIAYPSFPASNPGARAVALDGKLIPTETTMNYSILFSPDSKHVMWIGQRIGAPKQVVYVDGEPVLDVDQTGGLMNEPAVYTSVSSDGVFTVVAQHGGAMKRFRITPGTRSVDSMLR